MKCFINASTAVNEKSFREFVLFLLCCQLSSLYHHTPTLKPRKTVVDHDSLYKEFPPPQVGFEPIWLIPFLNQQPRNEDKMKCCTYLQ